MASTILVIDDDAKLGQILRINLEAEGYEVLLAGDGAEGLRLARQARPDLVVLDVMLPRIGGLAVCQTLREEAGYPDCPVLVLSACGDIEDRGKGFQSGADDYLVKPFDTRELNWRIGALLRRVRRPAQRVREIAVGAWLLCEATGEVEAPFGQRRLTRVEFDLLAALAETPDQVVDAEVLQRRLWGTCGHHELAALRVNISRLRQHLESDPGAPRYLRTVRGKGYAFHP